MCAESAAPPKHAPAIPLEMAKLLDCVATNKEVAPHKRAFDDRILLMSYASIRLSDFQRLEKFEINSDLAYGTLLGCKKKPHGVDWQRACPRMGMTGCNDWVLPLVEFRAAFAKTNGGDPLFAFPRLNNAWGVDSAEAAPYSPTRRKLAKLCATLGGANVESCTLRSPGNLSQ